MSGLLVPNIECTESVENFGRFVAEPLEKGFGITLGNSLRRVLLGYLPGAAVTQVRIEGVQHEFTVIPNAKEDVIEFLLNVKELRLKPLSNHGGTLILEMQGVENVPVNELTVRSGFEWQGIKRQEYLRVRIRQDNKGAYAELFPHQGSGVLSSASWADGLVVVEPGKIINTGDLVQYIPFQGLI